MLGLTIPLCFCYAVLQARVFAPMREGIAKDAEESAAQERVVTTYQKLRTRLLIFVPQFTFLLVLFGSIGSVIMYKRQRAVRAFP